MNRQQLSHSFEFHNHGILHQQVESVTDIDRHAVVFQWQYHFDVGPQTTLGQFVTQAGAIGAFEKSWTECRMHCDRSPHDFARDVIQFHP